VLVKGASPEHQRLLETVGTPRPPVDRGHVCATPPETVAHAMTHAGDPQPQPAG
jgi:hypothetical protein